MNKIYILVPLLGMLLFGGYYLNFSKGYDAEKARKKMEADAIIKAKKELDFENHQKAYQAAIDAAAARKLEREKKEQIEAAKKEARLQADERRDKAVADHRLLREQVERLKKELAAVDAEVAKYEELKKQHTNELVFLKEFVQKAVANQKYYYDLVDKIAAADKAKAEAEAAALLAKKNS